MEVRKWFVPLLALIALVVVGCSKDDDEVVAPPQSPGASTFSHEIATAWSEECYALVKADTVGPAPASRIYGFVGVATYEAVVAGMPDHQSLAGQLTDLSALPQPQPNTVYDWPTVLNATVGTVMTTLFAGSAHPSTQEEIVAFQAQWDAELQATLQPEVFERSRLHGLAIGTALSQWIATDGFSQYHNCAWTPPTGDQYWTPTPPAYKPAHEPCWGQLRTFCLARNGSDFECDPPPPFAFSTEPSSPFYLEALEVKTTDENGTPEDSIIAAFWADVPGSTGAPAGHWCSIATLLCQQYDMDLAEAAECIARSAIAMHDAFIECWKVKYQYTLIRPETYINRYIDADWRPSWPTPNFPEYTSGHSSCSGACSAALEGMLGSSCAFVDHTHDNRGFAPRAYGTLAEAAEEAALSRLLGGIHYRNGNNQGLYAGRCVGQQVNELQFLKPNS